MIFGRREKRPALLTFDRILVPIAGTEADDAALRLTAILLSGSPGKAFLTSGVFSRNESQRCDNQDSPIRPCSKTT